MATDTPAVRVISFEQACSQYVHRYTMEHVPAWANHAHFHTERQESLYYAPQFRSDREWYENTLFPGESELASSPRARNKYCYTANQTWPLGQWLTKRYVK